MRKADRVSCVCAVVAPKSRAMVGSDGRYMSVDRGPSAVSSARTAVRARVSGFSIADRIWMGCPALPYFSRKAEPANGPQVAAKPPQFSAWQSFGWPGTGSPKTLLLQAVPLRNVPSTKRPRTP